MHGRQAPWAGESADRDLRAVEGRCAFRLNGGVYVVLSHKAAAGCFYSREPREKEAGSKVPEAGGVARAWALPGQGRREAP